MGRGITVQTDDPANSRLRLTIRAAILASVVILPVENLMFNNASPRQNRTRLLVRRDPTETGELKIENVTPSADWFSVEATRLDEPLAAADRVPAGQPGDWLLVAELAEDPPYGVTRAELSFTTGLERQPKLTLPVMANLRPPVQLTAEPIELAPTEGEASEAAVLFSVRRGLNPDELRVEAEPGTLQVQVEPAGKRFYKAQVRWNGGALVGGALVFRLGEESYRVPVRVAKPKPAGA